MQLRLKDTKVKSMQLSPKAPGHDKQEGDLKFSVGTAFSESSNKSFLITFELQLTLDEAILDIVYDSVFETSESIDEEFKASHFPKVNAPAIAFPYLRAFISTFLINAGYDPIMLPSINFQALANK
ncbi:protein-export chaperone SecB [Vibrio parahaemolyticus]|uniref:protein-export chaperone SecB n=1 Tax=Vibrio parahaemolyticus TaxID=670 RepID=UPI000470CD51|nr:protein-export chaperone SecB [Vibrio parahaemolyticus]